MGCTALHRYLEDRDVSGVNTAFIGYLSNLCNIAAQNPAIASAIVKELQDQRGYLKLIASENYSSYATQMAMANLLTDKYAEGSPYHRFYAGCDNVDFIEKRAVDLVKKLFNAEHAYVQPHSGADANLMAYWAIIHTRVEVPALEKLGELNPANLSLEDWKKIRKITGNQKLLGMGYYSGGHLTHGYRANVSGHMFEAYTYGVNRETGLIDYEEIRNMAKEIKPLVLLAGYSAYPRLINFRKMREIADEVNAVLMADMAHFGGLVAGGAISGEADPVSYAHVVTSTTHKTLRGPRGGIILSKKEFAEAIDKGCPMVIGGPLPHVLAAKAVAFAEAETEVFKAYSRKIIDNARTMAEECKRLGMTIATGGTDNHLFLIDVRPYGVTGRQAEDAMRLCGITLNRNSLPFDPNGPWYTSGLRVGTPAVTTLGMGRDEMRGIARLLKDVLSNITPITLTTGKRKGEESRSKFNIPRSVQERINQEVGELLDSYPVYPELDLEFLEKEFL
jgi:glycine hydroxymethyltransferase